MSTMVPTDPTDPAAPPEAATQEAIAQLVRIDAQHVFGPMFFLERLAVLVRDRCPGEGDQLPEVTLWLVDGEALELCHIAMVGPRWVAVAARGQAPRGAAMPLMLLPYAAIVRVRIADAREGGASIGFDCRHPPRIVGDAAPPTAEVAP